MRRLNSSTKAAFLSSNLGRFPKKWHNPKWWCTTTCNPTECGEWRALIGQQTKELAYKNIEGQGNMSYCRCYLLLLEKI